MRRPTRCRGSRRLRRPLRSERSPIVLTGVLKELSSWDSSTNGVEYALPVPGIDFDDEGVAVDAFPKLNVTGFDDTARIEASIGAADVTSTGTKRKAILSKQLEGSAHFLLSSSPFSPSPSQLELRPVRPL